MLRALTLILLCLTPPVEVRLLRLEVTDTAPAFGGRAFGAVGAYERVTARATLGLDPADPRNADIADLASAPRNAEGLVEAASDVVILRPADATRGNGVLLFDEPMSPGLVAGVAAVAAGILLVTVPPRALAQRALTPPA